MPGSLYIRPAHGCYIRISIFKGVVLFNYGKFKFMEASTRQLREQVYRLRYEVYAVECGFENPHDFPDKLEQDEYDQYATHFVAMNEYDEVIGTIRIILENEKGFPVEHAADTSGFTDRPWDCHLTEVSRLAVSKRMRRRVDDGIYGVESYMDLSQDGLADDPERRKWIEKRDKPMIVLGLYKAVYLKCKALGITHMIMITEEKLFKSLCQFGFIFHQIGPCVEYHGARTPYGTSWDAIERHMRENHQDILAFLST